MTIVVRGWWRREAKSALRQPNIDGEDYSFLFRVFLLIELETRVRGCHCHLLGGLAWLGLLPPSSSHPMSNLLHDLDSNIGSPALSYDDEALPTPTSPKDPHDFDLLCTIPLSLLVLSQCLLSCLPSDSEYLTSDQGIMGICSESQRLHGAPWSLLCFSKKQRKINPDS